MVKIPSQTAFVTYQLSVINPDGSVARTLPEKRNLILDSGLNAVPSYPWPYMISYLHLGTGSDPVKRDSGAVTCTITAGAVVSNAAFFEAGDVGRLLKLDSGLEVKISAFISSTQVTVSDAATAAASEFTIWYVNRTGLAGQVNSSATVYAAGQSFDGELAMVTWTRTIDSGTFAVDKVIREAGWSPANGALFGMDLLPMPLLVLAGQLVRAKLTLSLRWAQRGPVDVPDMGNNGFNTAGKLYFECGYFDNSWGMPAWNCAGSIPWSNSGSGLGLYKSAITPVTMGAARLNRSVEQGTGSQDAYVSGSFQLVRRQSYSVSQGNGTIYGIHYGSGGYSCVALVFTTPQTKLDTETLSFSFVTSWGRELVN